MKIFKGLITFVLILIIVGGVGFLGWNLIYKSGMSNMGNMGNMSGMGNMEGMTDNANTSGNTSSQMDNMQNNNFFTTQAVQNKDKLNQITTTINDAINQITIDPYSKVTLPSGTQQPMMQPAQGNTTVNIYPNGNAAAGSATSPQMTTKGNYVYNQDKLEQLHNGIFKLAQGRMILDDLNNDLTIQSTMSEPVDYQGYSVLYNTILQNKIKLNNALSMINEASSLLNVNPYSSGTAYEYNTEEMKNLHNGIYKLAQGLLSGAKLNEEFTNQMVNISTLANNANSMGNMNMGQGFTLGTFNLSYIFKIILVIMIITLFIALFGAISSVLKRKVRE
ncbi:hypothetical protein D2A34_26080 [Clostridium chromiireducens]|uniref:Uncharacterized protein n=1 Tax=Clostridium chromiireducens TaxID=225345 RepID=A0A399IHJ1_9CLOT|nr:hypothetical protein [Clostridium chromiireducens]RII31837.1 hypothetical protein D2A34_26080 [Clostridium chromiireducens]